MENKEGFDKILKIIRHILELIDLNRDQNDNLNFRVKMMQKEIDKLEKRTNLIE
jgi:hypothetical protein